MVKNVDSANVSKWIKKCENRYIFEKVARLLVSLVYDNCKIM